MNDSRLQEAIKQIASNKFCGPDVSEPIVKNLLPYNDYYLVTRDFTSYMDAQARVDEAFKDRTSWTKKTIQAVARMGKFSSDRTIREYAEQIWDVEAAPFVPSSVAYKNP